jgi:cyclophilin family peptidyl-prolyl cis-trans isomerase/FKBP-type peptidyl-prolyl cis-trans isomerase
MTRRPRLLLGGLAVATLLLASCGGDDADPVAASDDEPATTEEPAAEPADEPATTEEPADEPSEELTDEVPARSGVETEADDTTGKPSVALPAESPDELVVFDVEAGTGEAAELGDTVEVNYVGVLSADGTEFDNSYDRGQTISVQLGAGQVISGWEQGLVGVRAGGRRQLDIPAALAYGDQGAGGVIPPGAAISFVVDVVSVTKPGPPPTLPPMADPADCPAPDGSSEQRQEFDEYPPTCIDVDASYTAEVVTNLGSLTIELDDEAAPLAVNNFVTLARYRYFDDVPCHRIIPGFMAQCGDPSGTGTGGPGYRFADELPTDGSVYVRGAVAMANSGPDTNGSQFFIVTGDATFLPPNYTFFGTVVDGDDTLDALDAVGNPESNGVPPLEPVTIESVSITES